MWLLSNTLGFVTNMVYGPQDKLLLAEKDIDDIKALYNNIII